MTKRKPNKVTERRERLRKILEELAQETVGSKDGLEYVALRVASAATLTDLAEELAPMLGSPVRPELLRSDIERLYQNAPEVLKAARERSAPVLLEQARAIADSPADTAAEVAHLRLRAESRMKLAALYSPDFRDTKQGAGATINLNFGSLLLQAHRTIAAEEAAPALKKAETTPPAALPAGDTQDFEVIPNDRSN